MAKRKKLSPIQKALIGVGQDVSAGSKKTAKKVAKPPPAPTYTSPTRTGGSGKAPTDRGAVVRTFGPLARQPTASERLSAKSEQLARKRARYKRRHLTSKKHKVDPTAKAIRRGTRSIDDALRLLESPEPLPDYYRKTMRPKTVRAIERHVARQPAIEEAEREALRKTQDKDTKILGYNVEAELEGRGELKKLADLGKKIVGAGGSKYNASGFVGTEHLERGVKDLLDAAALTPAAVYSLGAGAVEAARGRPERLKEMGDQFVEHDPIALALQGRGSEAVEEIDKHPGLAALSIVPAGALVSRAAGMGVRAAAKTAPTKVGRKKLERIGTQKRAPKRAPGTTIREDRTYSPGLVGKGAQVATERVQAKSAAKKYKKAAQAERAGESQRAEHLYGQATRRDPVRISEHGLAKRMDELEALAEPLRSMRVKRRTAEVDALLKGDPHAGVTVLVAQGIVRPNRKSLREYATAIDQAIRSGEMTPAQVKAAKRTRRDVAKAMAEGVDLKALKERADALADVLRPGQKRLVKKSILHPEAARKSPLMNVAVREMGAKWNPETKRLELRGEKVTAKQIERFVRSSGRDPEKLAYVSQRPSTGKAGDFYSHFGRPVGVSSKRRTGEAARKGALPEGTDAARSTAALQETLASSFDNYARFISQFRRKNEKPHKTRTEAQQTADDLNAQRLEGGGRSSSTYEWVPVPLKPQFGTHAQSESLMKAADEIDGKALRKGVDRALDSEGVEVGDWVLVPKIAAQRMAEHQKVLGPGAFARSLRGGQRHFRRVVLATTGTTWPAGNIAEGGLRLGVSGAGATANKFMRDVRRRLEQIDPDAADELMVRMGTGEFGMREMKATHSALEHYKGAKGQAVVEAGFKLASQPVVRNAVDAWVTLTDSIFHVNGLLETQFRTALGGKYARKFVATSSDRHQWKKAVEEAARGLRGTEAQVGMARWVRRAYGQYEAFSPSARFVIRYVTPFAPWAVNAVRFLTSVLPKDHPILTGLLATNDRIQREYLEEKGMTRELLPDYLLARIPAAGGLVRSFGPFEIAGDPTGVIAQLVLPQYQGVLMAFRGLDWRNKPLGGKDRIEDVTIKDKGLGALSGLLGVSVPGLTLGKKIKDRGVVGAFNPLHPSPHDPDLSRVFNDETKINARLEELPPLDKMRPSDPRYGERKRLNAKLAKLSADKFKLSEGKYGEKRKKSSKSGSSWDQYSGGSSGGGDWDKYAPSSSGGSSWDKY